MIKNNVFSILLFLASNNIFYASDNPPANQQAENTTCYTIHTQNGKKIIREKEYCKFIDKQVTLVNLDHDKAMRQLHLDIKKQERLNIEKNNLEFGLKKIQTNLLEKDKAARKQQVIDAIESVLPQYIAQQNHQEAAWLQAVKAHKKAAKKEKLFHKKQEKQNALASIQQKQEIASWIHKDITDLIIKKSFETIDKKLATQQASEKVSKTIQNSNRTTAERAKKQTKKSTQKLVEPHYDDDMGFLDSCIQEKQKATSPTSVAKLDIEDSHNANSRQNPTIIENILQTLAYTQTYIPHPQAGSPYQKYLTWSLTREFTMQQLEFTKKQQELTNAKILLKCKTKKEREDKKRELERNSVSWDFPYDNIANKALTEYSQLLHAHTSLRQLVDAEQRLVATQLLLTQNGLSLNWYLASNPELYNSIKEKYLTLQRRMSITERNEVVAQVKQKKSCSGALAQKFNQLAILQKLESFHTSKNGILNVGELLYPATSPEFFQNMGTLSLAHLEQAEQDMHTILASQTNVDIDRIEPVILALLQKIKVQPNNNSLAHKIIHKSAEIALVQSQAHPEFLGKIGALFFDHFQRKNEFEQNAYNQNEIADITKVHLAAIRQISNAIQSKPCTIKVEHTIES